MRRGPSVHASGTVMPHSGVVPHHHTKARTTSMGANHKDLADYLEGTRFGIRSLLSYASSIDVKPIRYGDLLQVIWYTATMARKQYQIW